MELVEIARIRDFLYKSIEKSLVNYSKEDIRLISRNDLHKLLSEHEGPYHTYAFSLNGFDGYKSNLKCINDFNDIWEDEDVIVLGVNIPGLNRTANPQASLNRDLFCLKGAGFKKLLDLVKWEEWVKN